ncbi:CPBP family intramembrane glutamic endopeptidase [Halomarina rubra]|uniref:CPBP family intramembrane glutamic endopeptidase n=1 Tax=Halomarina rubra TaxID=2071873 RepID=A0ABD6AQC0_9EURY|nr:CPBP family intramembrane glutamic endopeptidase [Halomarina rubra]
MPDWAAFVGVTAVVLFVLLSLARLSQSAASGGTTDTESPATTPPSPALDVAATVDRDAQFAPLEVGQYPESPSLAERSVTPDERSSMPTAALLLNVALSQGLLGSFLVFGAWYGEVPLPALGVDVGDPLSTGLPALGVGVAVGVGLYLANAAGAAAAAAAGVEYDESLRDLLTPASAGGWGLLLVGALPLIAGFEELLFRAALVGGLGAASGLSPWLLAAGSSVLFAAGHGAQGRMGMVVTGVLGFVLAGTFVLTNSLLAVVLAHYLVNALEFVVGGYLGVEWG